MSFRFRLVILFLFAGIALTVVGFKNSLMLVKGDTVNLSAPVSEFNKAALCEGTIDFVYGPFAVLETSQKKYGVTTSTRETNFYIVGDSYNSDTLVVFTTSDDMLVRKLDAAADEWYEYLTDENIDEGDYPEIAIDFKGYLAKQYSDKDFDSYYKDAIDDLGNIGCSPEDFAEYRIISGEIGKGSFVMLGVGLLLTALGVLLAIKTVKGTKKFVADAKAATAAQKAAKENAEGGSNTLDEMSSAVVDETSADTINE